MTLVQVESPDPIISVTDAKVRVPALASLDDAIVDAYVAAATESVQMMLGRALGVQTWDYSLDAHRHPWPGGSLIWGFTSCSWIELPLPPLVSVTSVSYLDSNGDTQTWDDAEYRVSGIGGKGRVSLASGGSWPSLGSYPEALTIRFVAGYSEVPAPIVQAILLQLGDLNSLVASSSSGSSGGLKRVVIEGVGSREYYQETTGSSTTSGSKATVAAERLLAPYRVF